MTISYIHLQTKWRRKNQIYTYCIMCTVQFCNFQQILTSVLFLLNSVWLDLAFKQVQCLWVEDISMYFLRPICVVICTFTLQCIVFDWFFQLCLNMQCHALVRFFCIRSHTSVNPYVFPIVGNVVQREPTQPSQCPIVYSSVGKFAHRTCGSDLTLHTHIIL